MSGRLLPVLSLVLLASPAVADDRPLTFERDVRPVLRALCFQCHGEEANPKGKLDLRLVRLMAAGGRSGPAVVPGKPDESLLWEKVASDEMPKGAKKLTAGQKATARRWIEQGAKTARPEPADPAAARFTAEDLSHWSFQPVSSPPAPDAGSPIDAFLLAKLRPAGIPGFSPEADPRTLIRRLTFDLHGLPPTPTEIDAFLSDRLPGAYERLVDRLLASPRYGERWGRHWLDVARYADTHGYDKDKPRPNAWPYRDYVIRALNADKPYARFVQEQVAGDVMYPGTADGIEALGFLAAGPWDFIGHAELPESKTDGKVARNLDRDEYVTATMGAFASLTVGCARCHDHKFDPITQEDYYALQAVFAAIDRTDKRYDPDPASAGRRVNLLAARRLAEARLRGLRTGRGVAGSKVAEWRAVAAERDAICAELRRLDAGQRTAYIGAVHNGTGTFVGTGASGGRPRPVHVLARGDVTRPGKLTQPGAVAALSVRFDLPADHTEGDRRAALARWLTDPAHPLVWRSVVNRVWQYHFGRGIVDSPNDFGKMGQPPSHPELLDWLTADFRDHGGSLKRLHKQIVTSAAYKQAVVHDPARAKIDADNRLLWRQNRRKLEAEEVRDSILAVAGKLDLTTGGPGFQDFVIEKPEHSPHYEYQLHDPDDPRSHRRSVYRFVVRSKTQPFLTALDCADPSLSVDRRTEGVTPQQALALLNNRLVRTMSRHFAARVEGLATDTPGRVTAAVRLALGRDPTPAERDELTRHTDKHGLADACRLVFNLTEFAFVD